MFCLGKLTSIHGDGRSKLAHSDSADEATDYEHSHIHSACLERTAQDGDDRSYEDSPATAQHICEQHVEDGPGDGTTLKGGHNTTDNIVRRVVKVLFEGGKGDGGGDDTRVITE